MLPGPAKNDPNRRHVQSGTNKEKRANRCAANGIGTAAAADTSRKGKKPHWGRLTRQLCPSENRAGPGTGSPLRAGPGCPSVHGAAHPRAPRPKPPPPPHAPLQRRSHRHSPQRPPPPPPRQGRCCRGRLQRSLPRQRHAGRRVAWQRLRVKGGRRRHYAVGSWLVHMHDCGCCSTFPPPAAQPHRVWCG